MTTTLPHHTSPLRVPESSDQEDSNDIYFARWSKYSELSPEMQKKLESEETAATIHKIQKFRNLSDETTANISRMIRGYYFGELKEFDFVPYLMREPNIDQAAAARLAQLVVKEIIEAEPEKTDASHQSNEAVDQQKSLPLLKALSRYPKLEEYVLTQQPFSTAENADKEPEKGTIKNWIFDYHMNNRGKARRSITDRDRYLSESKNTETLSEEDRQKVSLILESFDESTPLLIDLEKKEIIFNIIVNEKEAQKKPSITPERPAIGHGISKQENDGEDHFNDKFSAAHTGERPPLKHEEMMIPLHARKATAEETSDTSHTTNEGETPTKNDVQPTRSSFQMSPIDTYTPRKATHQEAPAEIHTDDKSEDQEKDENTAPLESDAQRSPETELPEEDKEGPLVKDVSNTPENDPSHIPITTDQEITTETEETATITNEATSDNDQITSDNNDTTPQDERILDEDLAGDKVSSEDQTQQREKESNEEEILPPSLDLTLDEEVILPQEDDPALSVSQQNTDDIDQTTDLQEQDPMLPPEETILEETPPTPLDLTIETEADLSHEVTPEKEAILTTEEQEDDQSSREEILNQPTTASLDNEPLPRDLQNQEITPIEPLDSENEGLLPPSLDLTLEEESEPLDEEPQQAEESLTSGGSSDTQEESDRLSDRTSEKNTAPQEFLDDEMSEKASDDRTPQEETSDESTDTLAQEVEDLLSSSRQGDEEDILSENTEASFIELSDGEPEDENKDEEKSEEEVLSPDIPEENTDNVPATEIPSEKEILPPEHLPISEDASDIPDIMTPKEDYDPFINLPKGKNKDIDEDNDPSDAEEEEIPQKSKAKPKRSPFQMKPIK